MQFIFIILVLLGKPFNNFCSTKITRNQRRLGG